jgi:hypothetical protein
MNGKDRHHGRKVVFHSGDDLLSGYESDSISPCTAFSRNGKVIFALRQRPKRPQQYYQP